MEEGDQAAGEIQSQVPFIRVSCGQFYTNFNANGVVEQSI